MIAIIGFALTQVLDDGDCPICPHFVRVQENRTVTGGIAGTIGGLEREFDRSTGGCLITTPYDPIIGLGADAGTGIDGLGRHTEQVAFVTT